MSWVFLLFDKHFSLIFLIFFVFIFYIALIMKIHFFLSIENWRGGTTQSSESKHNRNNRSFHQSIGICILIT